MSNKKQNMAPKPPVEFTPERKAQFVEQYRKTGLLYLSAELVGVSDSTVCDHRKSDREFDKAVLAAKQRWIDEVLVSEAVRRAVHGVKKPIIGGKFRDEVVAHEVAFSDTLMTFLLRSQREEFRPEAANAHGGGGGGGGALFFIPASVPQTLDQWQENYGEMARGTTRAQKP